VFEYAVVIVGGGPAGLTAGLHLSRAGHRTLLLERELFGGNLQHAGRLEDYPAFPGSVSGAQLASEMIEQATASGLTLKQAEVSGVELFSRIRWVACNDGRGFSCGVVILAGGTRFKTLGIPGEGSFRGRGVIDCTPCDAGFFVGRHVVVCGSNDYALRDALDLVEMGAQVTLLVPEDRLDASATLEARARRTPGLTVHHRATLEAIQGTERVERVVYVEGDKRVREQLAADGVAIRVGSEPSTDWLEDVVDLDAGRQILTTPDLQTSARHVLAAGDIRSGAQPSIATAVGDGATAAARAAELLMDLSFGM